MQLMTALAKLIAENIDIAPWEKLDVVAKEARVNSLLEGLTGEQRQALVLQAVEGLDEAQIADRQNRSLQDVAADLITAKRAAQQMFTEQPLPEIQERLEREALERPRRSHRT